MEPARFKRTLNGPEPLEDEPPVISRLGMMAITIVSGVTLLGLAPDIICRTHGASRSARLRREERQRIAAEAARQTEARLAGDEDREPADE